MDPARLIAAGASLVDREYSPPRLLPRAEQAEIRRLQNGRGGISIARSKGEMRFLRRRSAPLPANGPLVEVLEAEKAAAAAIAAARLEAEAWLDAERVTIATEKGARLQALAARAVADEEAARQAASADAAKVVAAANQFSLELRALSDRDLRRVVARHMAAILPGPEP